MTDEDGYVLFVRKNALQVLIPKYGLEGTVFLPDKKNKLDAKFEFDEEASTQTCGDVTLHVFDAVRVQVSIDQTNVQHQRLQLKLVQPAVSELLHTPCSTSTDILWFVTTMRSLQIANFSVDPVESASGEPPQKKTKAKK